jgi:hypothetical protein
MWDKENVLQQGALGIAGTNLIYAAFHYRDEPKRFIESLVDNLGVQRLEVDMLTFSGPAFAGVDNRLMSLYLVQYGLTNAVMFGPQGNVLQPSEVLYKKAILVERGSFRPVTHVSVDMLNCATAQFVQEPAVRGKEVVAIMEITMNNLRDTGKVDDADFLARVDLLSAIRKLVLVSDLGPFHRLADYLAKRNVERTGIVLGVPLLRELFNESHYRDLGGGILEAFGRLFTHAVRLYVYPTRDPIDGRKITADTLKVAPHLSHLLQHLLANGLVQSIPCEDGDLRTYSSEEVRSRICSGDPSWKDLVDPAVAKIIEATGYFGARCDVPTPGRRG